MRLAMFAFVSLPTAALAQPVDCEKLKTTKLPYEITMESATASPPDNSSTTSSTSKVLNYYQIYRNDEGYVIFYRLNEKRELQAKVITLNGLIQSLENYGSNPSSSKITYESPSSKAGFLQKNDWNANSTWLTTIGDTSRESKTEAPMKFIGEEAIFVGPCRFKAYVYRNTKSRKQDDRILDNTSISYFSPEIMTSLGSEILNPPFTPLGSKYKTTATDIRTDFFPVTKP